ncbi:MAG: MoaD/ThiS family protein [Deltaproteobacteria bacterium]|nr:MoaD/ThiS family protein [Deltaproteobacteria bacterium]
MVISVDFNGSQREVTRTRKIEIQLKKGKRVNDVLSHVKDLYPELSLPEDTYLVTVNNQVTGKEQILKANDRISLIPHIGGG